MDNILVMNLLSKYTILIIILLQGNGLFCQEISNIAANRSFVEAYKIFKTALENKKLDLNSTYDNQQEFRKCFKLIDDIIVKYPSSNIASDILQGKAMFETVPIKDLKSKYVMSVKQLFLHLCLELDRENIRSIVSRYYPDKEIRTLVNKINKIIIKKYNNLDISSISHKRLSEILEKDNIELFKRYQKHKEQILKLELDENTIVRGLLATEFADEEIFNLLITNIDRKNDYNIISHAANAGSLYSFKYCLKEVVTLPRDLIHAACNGGNKEIVRILLGMGFEAYVNLNVLGSKSTLPHSISKSFPLQISIAKNNLEICELLISFGADLKNRINHGDKIGYTLLHLSSELGNKEISRLLINSGADINAVIINNKKRLGYTPLHLAISSGDLELAKVMIELGADINIATKEINLAFGLLGFDDQKFYKDNLDLALEISFKNYSGKEIDFLNDNGFDFAKLRSGRTIEDHIGKIMEWKSSFNRESTEVLIADLVVEKFFKIKRSLQSKARKELIKKLEIFMAKPEVIKTVETIHGKPISINDLKYYSNQTLSELLSNLEKNIKYRERLKNSFFRCEIVEIKIDTNVKIGGEIQKYSQQVLDKIKQKYIQLAEDNIVAKPYPTTGCVVTFRVSLDGTMSKIRYVRSKNATNFNDPNSKSFFKEFDKLSTKSIHDTAPYPPLPKELKTILPQKKSFFGSGGNRGNRYIEFKIRFFWAIY